MLDDERDERLTTRDKNRQIPCFVSKARSELSKQKQIESPYLQLKPFSSLLKVELPLATTGWVS